MRVHHAACPQLFNPPGLFTYSQRFHSVLGTSPGHDPPLSCCEPARHVPENLRAWVDRLLSLFHRTGWGESRSTKICFNIIFLSTPKSLPFCFSDQHSRRSHAYYMSRPSSALWFGAVNEEGSQKHHRTETLRMFCAFSLVSCCWIVPFTRLSGVPHGWFWKQTLVMFLGRPWLCTHRAWRSATCHFQFRKFVVHTSNFKL